MPLGGTKLKGSAGLEVVLNVAYAAQQLPGRCVGEAELDEAPVS